MKESIPSVMAEPQTEDHHRVRDSATNVSPHVVETFPFGLGETTWLPTAETRVVPRERVYNRFNSSEIRTQKPPKKLPPSLPPSLHPGSEVLTVTPN